MARNDFGGYNANATYFVLTPHGHSMSGYGFIIPLPYGTDVDWLRNVLAAGGCSLTWNDGQYELEQPEVIPAKDALHAFPWSQRIIFLGGGMTHFLTLRRRVPAVEAPLASV